MDGAFRTHERDEACTKSLVGKYEVWNFNSGNYLFTNDTK